MDFKSQPGSGTDRRYEGSHLTNSKHCWQAVFTMAMPNPKAETHIVECVQATDCLLQHKPAEEKLVGPAQVNYRVNICQVAVLRA